MAEGPNVANNIRNDTSQYFRSSFKGRFYETLLLFVTSISYLASTIKKKIIKKSNKQTKRTETPAEMSHKCLMLEKSCKVIASLILRDSDEL